ncbi:MAG: twin-arginine translocase subunit TatC [Candidatus Hydrothermarchaeota archaeon]
MAPLRFGLEVLDELRGRLKLIIALTLVGLVGGWTAAYYLILKVKADVLPPGVELVVLTPLELVVVQLKVSMVLTVALLLPFLLYWVARPLRVLKRSLLPWLLALAAFFVAGMAFAYYLLIPYVVGFLTANAVEAGIEPLYSLDEFTFFVISLSLILGLVFEFPVVIAWLSRMGLVSSRTLREKRRYAYVGIFTASAIITPDPSPVSQILVAIPFMFFYELSIVASWFFQRRRQST